MTVSTSALRKGAPPARTNKARSPIDTDPRPTEGKNRALQLMVPPDVFVAFSARAGQEFGYTKGAKSRLFLAMCGIHTKQRALLKQVWVD